MNTKSEEIARISRKTNRGRLTRKRFDSQSPTFLRTSRSSLIYNFVTVLNLSLFSIMAVCSFYHYKFSFVPIPHQCHDFQFRDSEAVEEARQGSEPSHHQPRIFRLASERPSESIKCEITIITTLSLLHSGV